jgi:hypothetical protein
VTLAKLHSLVRREQTVGLVARLAGAQPAHPSLSPMLGSGAQEFSSIKKCQRVLVSRLVSFFYSLVRLWPFQMLAAMAKIFKG